LPVLVLPQKKKNTHQKPTISIIPKPQIVNMESKFGTSRWDGWKHFSAPILIFHYGHTLHLLVSGVILLLTQKSFGRISKVKRFQSLPEAPVHKCICPY